MTWLDEPNKAEQLDCLIQLPVFRNCVCIMSLVSGPGRAGGDDSKGLSDQLHLAIEPHVKYIQSLDSVRSDFRSCNAHVMMVS